MRALPLVALALASCAVTRTPTPSDSVAFRAPALYPEGVAYDPVTGAFLVGSFRSGTVGQVAPDGAYRPFAGPGPWPSTFGVAVDAARRRVWIAGGDLGVGARSSPETAERAAGVAVYDADTGAALATVPLDELVPGRHLANDLALDASGAAYLTDSFADVVYRVPFGGAPSVFARSPLFASDGGVGLNGVAVHPDGFLLVTHFARGEVLRVPLDRPGGAERVALPEALVGADGLVLLGRDRLVVVQNEGADRTVLLVSDDGWRSARVEAAVPSALPFPTTAARVGDAVFVLNARLDGLFANPAAAADADFLLQRVAF